MNEPLIPKGSVHGRFQPLHNDHLEYLLAAFVRCSFVYVGITQHRTRVMTAVDDETAMHRSAPSSNPLTFYQRATAISATLKGRGISTDRFAITPFPIENPGELTDYVPLDAVAFTTNVEPWNESKIALLEGAGYSVEVLWARDSKTITGSSIRSRMGSGDNSWEADVPAEVADRLRRWEIPKRLQGWSE